MPIRVMLVDDSTVVRGLMQRAFKSDPEIEVVASAVNGQIAIDLLKRNDIDVIILDIEMPVMDGMTALPKLLEISPKTHIIVASIYSLHNAEISMQALALGASDYVPKPSSQEADLVGSFYAELIGKIKLLAHSKAKAEVKPSKPKEPVVVAETHAANRSAPAKSVEAKPHAAPPPATALAIASSTGGPQALISMFQQFKGKALRTPIFITQHMPANFTMILAEHISKAIDGDCREARHGEVVEAGRIYIAPGDFHMTVHREDGKIILKLDQNPPENFCRPSADPMLRSLSKVYGKGLLCAVLTGIGADGTSGAVDVVAAGGIVIAQDEESSVVYGMPKAVAEAKLTSAILPLNQIAQYLLKAVAT